MIATCQPRVILVLGLFLLAVLGSYAQILSAEFLNDDLRHIQLNPALQKIDSWKDVLSFQLQPSRPLSNFFIAATYWAGGDASTPHRAVSLLLHLLVCLALFANVSTLCRRLNKPDSWQLYAAIAVGLFATHPLNSDLLAFGTYRWEILGALFTLVATWQAQREAERDRPRPTSLVVICGLVALAQLSKEPYFIFAPASCLLAAYLPTRGKFPWRMATALALSSTVAAVAVWYLIKLPTAFPYKGYIGPGVLPAEQHLRLAAHALVETVGKFLLLKPLTLIRLSSRLEYDLQWSVTVAIPVLFTALIFWMAALRSNAWVALWGGLAGLITFFYLAIPNVDMGAQHYHYLAVAAGTALSVPLFAKLAKRKTVSTFAIATVVLLNIIVLNERLQDYRTRERSRLAELENFPQNGVAWAYVALDLAADPSVTPSQRTQFTTEALKRFPNDPYLLHAQRN